LIFPYMPHTTSKWTYPGLLNTIVQKDIDGMNLFIVKKMIFMSDRNQQGAQNPLQDDMTGKGHGR
ncbi:MAG: hypothetical protein J7502_17660, partial [Flavisolibacter sp.]|nr:hypothetical protein [Flavisolibacter sp.]